LVDLTKAQGRRGGKVGIPFVVNAAGEFAKGKGNLTLRRKTGDGPSKKSRRNVTSAPRRWDRA